MSLTLSPPAYTLHPTHLDIWHIALKPAAPFEHQLHWLNAEELERYQRFYFPQHRRRFAQARLAMKAILAQYLNDSPHEIDFQYQARGKPELSHPSHITFNLSHTQDMALLAVGQQHAVGIDIEHFSLRAFQGIATQCFSPNEQAYLQQTPSPLIPLRFFSIWSRKEALIKANGLGLSYPTQEIDLLTDGLIEDPLHKQSWCMQTFFPAPAVAAAVCYHPSIATLQHFYYDV